LEELEAKKNPTEKPNDSDVDSTDLQAAGVKDFVDPKRGGQKRGLEEEDEGMEEKKEGGKDDKGTPSTPPAAKVLPKAKGKKASRVNKKAAKAAVRPAPNMLAMKAMKKKRPVLTEKKDVLELFERFSPVERQEAYLMLGGKYLVGCTRKRDSRYKEFMEKIKEEMQSDKIATTKTAAVERCGELLSAAP